MFIFVGERSLFNFLYVILFCFNAGCFFLKIGKCISFLLSVPPRYLWFWHRVPPYFDGICFFVLHLISYLTVFTRLCYSHCKNVSPIGINLVSDISIPITVIYRLFTVWCTDELIGISLLSNISATFPLLICSVYFCSLSPWCSQRESHQWITRMLFFKRSVKQCKHVIKSRKEERGFY